MSFLSKGKKIDLYNLALELRLEVTDDDKIVDLRDKIIQCALFKDDNQFVKDTFNNIVEERKKVEDAEEKRLEQEELKKRLAEERAFELEKLQLQAQQRDPTAVKVTNIDSNSLRFDLKSVLPTFVPDKDDMSIFLVTFERQMKLLNVSKDMWVSHLIGVLPSDVAKLIAREPEEMFGNYPHIRNVLLQRFKLTAERFRILFSRHQKHDNSTWKDFYFELRNYFEGWLTELDINSFDKLKDLIIADQIKKKCPQEYRNHYLDGWEKLNDPVVLSEKLDLFENINSSSKKLTNNSKPREIFKPPVSRNTSTQEFRKKQFTKIENPDVSNNQRSSSSNSKYMTSRNVISTDNRPPISCYGCGAPGFIKAKCPKCSPKQDTAHFNAIKMFTCFTSPVALIDIIVYEATGTVCADTGASQSVGGELMFNFLKNRGQTFTEFPLDVSLADGQFSRSVVKQTTVPITIRGRTFHTDLIFLPHAKANRTLLGVDFLKKSGIVMDMRKNCWYFSDEPYCKIPFSKDSPLPVNENPFIEDCIPCPENSNIDDRQIQSNTLEANKLSLREEEGHTLDAEKRNNLSTLLNENEDIFRLGGEPTPYIKHFINTGDHPPVSSPPYRLSPKKKDLLKKEIDELLANNTIEECESPYAAPVVLVPKPNGSVRLCIDYRKLNSITVPDKYPLPLMDALLHDAKSTKFMSTLDLKSGYHQIEVNPADQDKTAFVCPFGTFRYKRMPYGLRNAPATFQRLMDQFRNGLPSVNILTYLDDIIVLSPTFEQHIEDLRIVFDRLRKFKLCANREKCKFACARVKYLGLWITPNGIEVDQDKVAAIQNIPCPRNVKQLQSFLQTCSWYRKFIPNFSGIARPLSNLTKKNTVWKWTENEQNAFQSLKKCLITPPVLKQADATKPFIIRTDASAYALGAVLLQGDSPAEEHPIEYASRLLSSAEKNYSTTEREALAVVWALDKFRGYIEGSEIKVASDHQPLKWLMSLKSPTGRLARWALQIQSYNLKIDYVPGKCNVVADLLSRPLCTDEETFCELRTIVIDLPTRPASELRTEQLKDPELKKIIDSFEDVNKGVDFANWTGRGYVMNQGVLYRYSPHSEVEEAQLVVPSHERENILKLHHDDPTAGHYGADGTFSRISARYYWTGMRKYITDYVKSCAECIRYKATNQKPAGLLQTPVPTQRFESISIDLFGPLPETREGMKWIFIVEDCTSKWVELFPLKEATAKECALTLLNEVFLRYGLPRRLISDNGPQFVSAVMQQMCYVLKINQSLIPVYHPQANPVERKNRDLKPRLAMLVGNNHTSWIEQLPAIRFAMNTAKCETTGCTAAYLTFARELRTLDDVNTDLRAVIHNDNFVPEFTPFLKRFEKYMSQIKENIQKNQDRRKVFYDKTRRQSPNYKTGDLVWVKLHPVSKASQGKSAKFMPKKDGPYLIISQKSPTTFVIASCEKPNEPLGVYHASALTLFQNISQSQSPVVPLKRRGRPRKQTLVPEESPKKNIKKSIVPSLRRDGLRRCRGRM